MKDADEVKIVANALDGELTLLQMSMGLKGRAKPGKTVTKEADNNKRSSGNTVVLKCKRYPGITGVTSI